MVESVSFAAGVPGESVSVTGCVGGDRPCCRARTVQGLGEAESGQRVESRRRVADCEPAPPRRLGQPPDTRGADPQLGLTELTKGVKPPSRAGRERKGGGPDRGQSV